MQVSLIFDELFLVFGPGFDCFKIKIRIRTKIRHLSGKTLSALRVLLTSGERLLGRSQSFELQSFELQSA